MHAGHGRQARDNTSRLQTGSKRELIQTQRRRKSCDRAFQNDQRICFGYITNPINGWAGYDDALLVKREGTAARGAVNPSSKPLSIDVWNDNKRLK